LWLYRELDLAYGRGYLRREYIRDLVQPVVWWRRYGGIGSRWWTRWTPDSGSRRQLSLRLLWSSGRTYCVNLKLYMPNWLRCAVKLAMILYTERILWWKCTVSSLFSEGNWSDAFSLIISVNNYFSMLN
jgi:hypothetical protein